MFLPFLFEKAIFLHLLHIEAKDLVHQIGTLDAGIELGGKTVQQGLDLSSLPFQGAFWIEFLLQLFEFEILPGIDQEFAVSPVEGTVEILCVDEDQIRFRIGVILHNVFVHIGPFFNANPKALVYCRLKVFDFGCGQICHDQNRRKVGSVCSLGNNDKHSGKIDSTVPLVGRTCDQ